MAISTDDYVSISDFLGRYCWLIDEGEVDDWVALWTEDGAFMATGMELVGREKLKLIHQQASASGRGTTRHVACNLHCDYGPSRDTVQARLYNYVTNWSNNNKPPLLAVCKATIIRDGQGWKMKRNDVTMLRAG